MSNKRFAPNGTPVVVQTGASIIVEDAEGRILMQQRSDDGTWSYPGGRIEIDETVEDGARREVFEECGLRVGQLELLGVFSGQELNHVYPNGNEVCGVDIVYISRDYTGTLGSADGEAKAMGFYPINALPNPISPMNAKQIGAYLARRGASAQAGLYGALEAGGTKMVCAICQGSKVLHRVSIPTRTPEETVPEMVAFFRQYPIQALGIGCFGPIDLDKSSPSYGSITTTPKLAWQNYNIVNAFREALGVRVGFDTDVNASALGEATFGCTRQLKNSIYITIGTGVGVGVIVDGKPYHGRTHPEGGHIFLSRHPSDPMERGVCPFHENCMEGFTSGPALEKRWGQKGAELADRTEVWELEAFYIAQALCSYILTLSPERIVLGGGVMHQRQLLPLIRREVQLQLAGYVALPELEEYITAASLNDDQGILGCVRLAMDAEREETL